MLFKQGQIKMNNINYPQAAMVLLPDKICFLAYPMNKGEMIGGMAGGLLGSLVGRAIDASKKEKEEKKDITTDSFYASLSPDLQNKVKKYPIYKIIAKKEFASIKKTFLGEEFVLKNNEIIKYSGLIYKKAIAEFLMQNNYPISL